MTSPTVYHNFLPINTQKYYTNYAIFAFSVIWSSAKLKMIKNVIFSRLLNLKIWWIEPLCSNGESVWLPFTFLWLSTILKFSSSVSLIWETWIWSLSPVRGARNGNTNGMNQWNSITNILRRLSYVLGESMTMKSSPFAEFLFSGCFDQNLKLQ